MDKRLLLLVKKNLTFAKEVRDTFYKEGLNFFGVEGRLYSKFSTERREATMDPPPTAPTLQ